MYTTDYPIEYYATTNEELTTQEYIEQLKEKMNIGSFQSTSFIFKNLSKLNFIEEIYFSYATYGNNQLEIRLHGISVNEDYTNDKLYLVKNEVTLVNETISDFSILNSIISVETISIEEV